MNLIYFAAFIAACGAAKLDRTYLPPASAALAGGSPGSLQAPLTRTSDQSSQIVPPGGFVNDREGVVVNAAIADTRASSQQSGLGGTRNSYGSTDSKVGDAAFRTTSPKFPQAQNNIVPDNFAFGAADDASLNPDLSAFYQPSPAFRPGNVQIVRDYASNIVKYQNDIGLDKFNYTYETDNGIKASESGVSINGVQAEGGFSYTGDDGHVYSVSYTADEGGFRPHGSHLPTPPPIPVEILKSLEQNAKDEAAGLHDDGSYDAQKYNEEYDYTKFNHDDYNDWLLNKIGEELFGSANLASKNKTVKPDSSKVTGASGFDATNNKDTLLNEQNGQLSNNGFGSRNEYSSPNKGQSENVFSAGGNKDSHNVLPAQSLSQQQLQAQSAFTKPSSSETSQSSFTSQISSLPSHNFNTQEAISSFVVGNDNNPSLSSQSYNKPSQDNPFTDIFLNKNQPINQESTLSSNKQTPQNSFSQSFASVSSPSFQPSLTSQQFLSTNNPLQSTQNLNSRLPTTHFSSVSSESFNPSQKNIAQTQYTKKPISSFATSFSSVMPTKQPQITLTTPLESTKINEFSNSFDSGKTELLGVTSAPYSTLTNDQSSQFSFQNVQYKEKYPTQSAPTLSGNTFSDFSIFSFNSNPQTTSQDFDNTQTIQYQNKEKLSTESPSTLNGNTFSGFRTSSFNSNPQTTSQNFDNSKTTQLQNKEKLPTDSTSALSGSTFSGFSKPSFNTSPQTTSQSFENTQTTQIQNNKPQVTQVVFSSNRPGDSVFASNTQRPTYNTQSNQFIGQPQGADHSYIYNRPLKPFQTPFDSNNRVILPSGSLSSRFDKVTQSVSTPLDSTFSTQYQSQTNSNNSPDPTTLTPFSSSFTTLKENDRNKNTFEVSNGITQASISPFPSILPTISSNFKPPSTQFNLKPFQQAVYNTPGQSQFSQTSTTSAIAPTQFVSTISDNQKYNTQSQSDQRPSEMQEKPNNGEIYEYNKPTQSKTEKEVVDLNQKTERPQFTISSIHFNKDGSTTTSVAQNTAQIEQQKPLSLFEEQSSLPVNQQSFIDAIHNVNSGLTTQFTQSSTNDNTMSQFKQPSRKPGLEASNYKPPKFFPSTVSSDTFITQKQDTQIDTTTTISQNPTFGVQSNTGFSGSDIKDATTFNYRQSNQQTETQLNYKPSTPIPGAFQTKPEISQSQSFSPQLTTIQPQFGIQSGIQFGQGIFSNKATTVPQIQQSVTKFDFKPSTSMSSMQQSPSNRFNPQNTDKQLDSTSFVQSINEPSKFGIQSNTQESQGSFDSKRTTISQSSKPSQQTSTTFNEPSTSNPTQTETSSGITQFGEVYDYTIPTQGLLIPSPNKNNSQVSHLKPEIGVQTNTRFGQQTQPPHFNLQPTTQFNQKENEKDKSQSHSTQAEPVTGIEYYTGSTLDPSTSEDQKTFNTKVPDQASTSGEIYNYKKPTQSTLISQNNDNVQPNQAKPQFEAVINTDFGPQIIPIFQRERPTQFGQQTQQSHFNLQSNTQLNPNENEKDGTMSHFTQNEPTTGTLYNTGSTLLPTTPQDQMIFNTKVPDQTSTTGEIYDYRKPTQGLLTSQNKNNVQPSQIKPQFGTRINTDFSPQIIPIFQREQPTQFGQKTQQSHFNIQSNQNVNEKDETIPYFTQSEPVTSQDYNTGTTPQDQTIFNTRVSDQASTTGEIYEYTKPEKGLPSQSQKENSLFGQKIQGQQSGSQATKTDGHKSNLPTTVQSTQAPITTIGVAQSESIGNSQNANTLMPQSVYTQGSGSETKLFDSRPQLAFHSACCKGIKAENNRGNAPVNQVLVNKFNPNFGADAFEQNKNIGQVDQNKNRGEAQASDLPSFQDFEPQKGSQTYAGIGEKFGGPRKPPSFDETGYNY